MIIAHFLSMSGNTMLALHAQSHNFCAFIINTVLYELSYGFQKHLLLRDTSILLLLLLLSIMILLLGRLKSCQFYDYVKIRFNIFFLCICIALSDYEIFVKYDVSDVIDFVD